MVKRKVCVFVGSRANYSSIKSAMKAIKEHSDLELQLVVGASAVLDKYGKVITLLEKDGFEISEKIHVIVEGETPETMAKSTGLALMEFSTALTRLQPDFVVVVGDRFEIMAPAIASVYMNIPLVHTMGGEVTGTIDESIRHAVTKLAHIHFPANEDSLKRIEKLGEHSEYIYNVGCPRIDEVAKIEADIDNFPANFFEKYGGVGKKIDLNKPFLLVSQHPVTTEFDDSERQITETIKAIEELNLPTIMLWPNSDAGSDHISRGIRKFRERNPENNLHLFKNLPMDIYIKLMIKSVCLIGNSSSGIREGEFLGVPCVNIGTRQVGRQRGENVIDVDYDSSEIVNAIKKHMENGKYLKGTMYGNGTAGEKIAEILSKVEVKNIQKMINY
jgi:UDP-hydrolysing UDP-N-acetyl-D-glucosamine 2-epimerase